MLILSPFLRIIEERIKKEVAALFSGERLQKVRRERGWSQERLGEVIGVSRSAVNKYEMGVVTDLKASQVELMAEALHVAPEYLVCWTDDPTPVRISASNIQNSAVVQGNNATTLIVRNGSVERKELSDEEVELLRIFEALDVKGRTALLSAAFDLEERIPPKED